MWASLIIPGFAILVWQIPRLRSPKIWLGILALAVVAALGVIGFEMAPFIRSEPSPLQILKVSVFQMIKMTEVPLVELGLGSLISWLICRRWVVD